MPQLLKELAGGLQELAGAYQPVANSAVEGRCAEPEVLPADSPVAISHLVAFLRARWLRTLHCLWLGPRHPELACCFVRSTPSACARPQREEQ